MREKAVKKRNLILEKAQEIFLKCDFDQVTMTSIIKACGISHGGIYRYFSSPTEILLSLFERDTNQLFDAVGVAIWERRSAIEVLREIFDIYRKNAWHSKPNMWARYNLFFKTHQTEQPVKQKQYKRLIQSIENVLEYGIKRQEIKTLQTELLAHQLAFFLEGLDANVSTIGLTQEEIQKQFELWLKTIQK
ncbi:MAG: TetR/AcrR family transcriptional regulator [Pseudoramibacter sp.]